MLLPSVASTLPTLVASSLSLVLSPAFATTASPCTRSVESDARGALEADELSAVGGASPVLTPLASGSRGRLRGGSMGATPTNAGAGMAWPLEPASSGLIHPLYVRSGTGGDGNPSNRTKWLVDARQLCRCVCVSRTVYYHTAVRSEQASSQLKA
eukprot:5726745-Prymnesium_polylepis.2